MALFRRLARSDRRADEGRKSGTVCDWLRSIEILTNRGGPGFVSRLLAARRVLGVDGALGEATQDRFVGRIRIPI